MRELILAASLLSLVDPPLELRPRDEAWRPGEILAAAQLEPGQALPLAAGTPLGELVLADEWLDARGHRIAPGRYALRYALQPRLKDHLGLDASRDFALLVPLEAGPGDPRAQARHALDSRHLAVMALVPAWAGAPGQLRLDDGRLALVARIGELSIAFVVIPGSEPQASGF